MKLRNDPLSKFALFVLACIAVRVGWAWLTYGDPICAFIECRKVVP